MTDLEPLFARPSCRVGEGVLCIVHVISESPLSLLTEKVMALDGAGPKFRPYSAVCCCVVVWRFHEMDIFANCFLLHLLLLAGQYRFSGFYSLDSVLLLELVQKNFFFRI